MNFARKYAYIIITSLMGIQGFAQQDPMYSMYMYDKLLVNPGFTGSSNWVVATIKHRDQFTGFNGHPSTQTFNIHAPIQRKHIGIGLKIVNDKNAIISNLNTTALFSYHLNFFGGKLSTGLEAGVFNRSINYQKLILSTQKDDAIPGSKNSSLVPDLSYGIYYQKKQSYFGLSQSHLIKKAFNFSENGKPNSHLSKHLYLLAGNVFTLSKYWSVEPSMLLKHQKGAPLQVDLNTTVYYDEKFGVGLQYRTGDALVMAFRANITDNIRVCYSYDMTQSKLAKYSKGAHEIIVSYGIKLPPPPVQKEIHPRYYF